MFNSHKALYNLLCNNRTMNPPDTSEGIREVVKNIGMNMHTSTEKYTQ